MFHWALTQSLVASSHHGTYLSAGLTENTTTAWFLYSHCSASVRC